MNTGKKADLTMSKNKVAAIGLIVEDNSDYECLKVLISRITNKSNITFKKAIGNGCGKVRRKAVSYSQVLNKKGCNMVILVHDLDRHNFTALHKELTDLIKKSPAKYNFICIPIEEIEGWFLSDTEGIKDSFSLKREPKISGSPELVSSPKEKLNELIYSCSGKSKRYLNTKHNSILAENVSLVKMKKKCKSFEAFYNFIDSYEY